MTTSLIDFRQARTAPDVPGLQSQLSPLIGEPFCFARMSYGDELTLHFGDLRPARSPKLAGKMYGAFILGVRGSTWILKSGSEPLVLSVDASDGMNGTGTPIAKTELEANPHIQPDARIIAAIPFAVKPANGFGLRLRFSDGSELTVLPTGPAANEPEDENLPVLADWELLTPSGLLNAGPGLEWSFQPNGEH